ncbi:hypothetical protein A2Z33_05755 [Candidatus Gottesmanbacteria bacterium RBG_16_52_11]|uniref:Uncharacterized protein n=1 Tax=Candidatus Gottesmanbacteria bacterium RBG_16_52_11 TaxID=1798374 RepID=A0A1F5YX61_9BACT|nr:MAG: hypothetical protein A2Z33_05755 [Candidatus Gottesmanbacteria bacterium RBG_16_52_11]
MLSEGQPPYESYFRLPLPDRVLPDHVSRAITAQLGDELCRNEDRFGMGPEALQWIPLSIREAVRLLVMPDGEIRTHRYPGETGHTMAEPPVLAVPPETLTRLVSAGGLAVGIDRGGRDFPDVPDQSLHISGVNNFYIPEAALISLGALSGHDPAVEQFIPETGGPVGYILRGRLTMVMEGQPLVRTLVRYEAIFTDPELPVLLPLHEARQYLAG